MDCSQFSLGRILITPGVLAALEETEESPWGFLRRHASGDWGELCAEDRQENEFALGKHLRLFSAYLLRDGQKLWIITEADRSATTLLLPEEY